MRKEELTYEQALAELEMIVQQLQQQTISIDDLEKQSKRAADLVVFCQEKLRKVELALDDTFELGK